MKYQDLVNELADQFRNGNREHVWDELRKLDSLKAASVAVSIFKLLQMDFNTGSSTAFDFRVVLQMISED